MFKSNKQKFESLEEYIDDSKRYIDAVARDIHAFKREVRKDIEDLQCKRIDIVNLKLQYNALSSELEESKEAGSTAVAQIREDISLIRSRVEMLDKWDDETRDKFSALMDYFEISFTEGRRVVEREEEA